MKKRIHLVSCAFLMAFSWSCSKPAIPEPEAVVQIAPANNDNCLPLSSTATTGVVSFDWDEALHTDSYELVVRNNVSQIEQKKTVDLTSATLTVERGASYTWWVISSSEISDVNTKSEVWSFYLEALQQENFLPFPARLISPTAGEVIGSTSSGQVNLQWEGSDLDDDVAYFQIFTGTSASQLNLTQDNHTSSNYSLTGNSGQTYFWQIITVDAGGNKSQSAVQSFTIS